jgi:hypothetical protein
MSLWLFSIYGFASHFANDVKEKMETIQHFKDICVAINDLVKQVSLLVKVSGQAKAPPSVA